MAQLHPLRCQKPAATAPKDSAGDAGGGRQCLPSCGGIGWRLVRKLKKQSKMLCTAAAVCSTKGGGGGGGGAVQCQYDPLSYSRNFDGCCAFDEDSSHFYYTFSSRFARPLAASH